MGDLTLAEVGRALARIEAGQADTHRQLTDLARTVHLVVHGPPDQPAAAPTGLLPRMLELERFYREHRHRSVGWWERMQAGIIAGVISIIIHTIQNWDLYKGGHH